MRNQPPYYPSSPDGASSGNLPSTGLRPGDKLDKYTIVAQIGAGGMASVWKGHDVVLDRYVAIKEFSAAALAAQDEDKSQELSERFRAEADVQKRLAKHSPHLVQVLDFIDENRGLFIVMEFIQGKSLEQFLAQTAGPIEQRQALGIVGAAALALGVIHKNNVVHRDLKPSNILMPDEGGLKVSDFGIASIVGDQEAMAVGSVRYMAPELFREEPVDGRADIYSLGMIAYEMLAGRDKFNDAFKVVLRDTRNQALRWMKWHTNARAKAPALSQINPDIPPALSELVARMMEKDPAQRVSSSEQLLDAMRRLFAANQSAGQVAPSAAAGEAVAQASSNPTAALPKTSKLPYILAAVLLIQVAGIGGMFYYRHAKEESAKQAVRDNARQLVIDAANAYKAGDYAGAESLYTQLSDNWGNDPELGPSGKAGVYLTQAKQHLEAGQYNDALAKIEAAREFRIFKTETLDSLQQEARSRSAFESETKAIAELMDKNNLGEATDRLGRFTDATDVELQTLQALNERLLALKSNSKDAQTIAEGTREKDAHGLQVGITYLQGQLNARPSEKVRAVLDDWLLQQRYEGLLTQARTYESEDKLGQAIDSLTKALAINDKPEQHEKIKQLRIRTLLSRAQLMEERSREPQAIDAYTEILGLDKNNATAKAALARIKVSSQRDAFLQAARNAAGRKNFEEAIVQYQNAMDIQSDDKTRDDLRDIRILMALTHGRTALNANELETARQHINSALTLDAENKNAQNMLTELGSRSEYLKYLNAADKLRDQGKFSEAQYQYLRAQRVARTAEIQQRLNDTEINQLLAQARYYAQKEEWRSSRAMLRTLLAKRANEEASRLLEEVSKELPPEREEDNAQTP